MAAFFARGSSPFDELVASPTKYTSQNSALLPGPPSASHHHHTLPTPHNSSPLLRSTYLSDLDDPAVPETDIRVHCDSDGEDTTTLPTSAHAFSAWLRNNGHTPASPLQVALNSTDADPTNQPHDAATLALHDVKETLTASSSTLDPAYPSSTTPAANYSLSHSTTTTAATVESPARSGAVPTTVTGTGSHALFLTTGTIVGPSSPQAPIVIGRGRKSTLDLTRQHREVSRVHATIRCSHSAQVNSEASGGSSELSLSAMSYSQYLMDITGRNGVKVDSQLYPAGTTIPLLDGQQLDFVGVQFRFIYPATSTQSPVSAPMLLSPPPPSPLAPPSVMEIVPEVVEVEEEVTEQMEEAVVEEEAPVNSIHPVDVPLTASATVDPEPPSSPASLLSPLMCDDSSLSSVACSPSLVDLEESQPSPVSEFPLPEPHLESDVNSTIAVKGANEDCNGPSVKRLKIDPDTPTEPVVLRANLLTVSIPEEKSFQPTSPVVALPVSSDLTPQSPPSIPSPQSPTKYNRPKSKSKSPAKPKPSLSPLDQAGLLPLVIDTMVFSAKRSHTVADIFHALTLSHPQLVSEDPSKPSVEQGWKCRIRSLMVDHPCFGRVVRHSKDASNRIADDLWYYEPHKDSDSGRQESYEGLVRTARRCTLKDNQYYFKPVPKHKPLKKWIYIQEKEPVAATPTTTTTTGTTAVQPPVKRTSDKSEGRASSPLSQGSTSSKSKSASKKRGRPTKSASDE
ncbi:hypothetical protein BJ085DRAFT_37442 [Dimargaris cristalligena]|uniref:FHA domain-containing protein n=1 Tax=Dimargaris cristalligena TaxID=215637 RepID=A0A4Q0A3S2_9FUNG|nr:hypothetical protein BJ085DRAFT_37442 [Dimargaris cristalligena]|eukprot:RKP40231.1 hypothetical protein BJ085DRAFT_37442 [Dimargaris cristalligena]